MEFNFYDDATNVVSVENLERNKTHLAIAIEYSVIIRRNSICFIKFNKFISILKNAYNERTFDRKQFLKYSY